jgi:cell division septum initiation protein DivIVA
MPRRPLSQNPERAEYRPGRNPGDADGAAVDDLPAAPIDHARAVIGDAVQHAQRMHRLEADRPAGAIALDDRERVALEQQRLDRNSQPTAPASAATFPR